MSETVRALVVVLAIAMVVFTLAKKYAVEIGINPADFVIRRNAWIMITSAAFLANNFWLFSLVAIWVLLYAKKKDTNQLALVFFVLFAVPLFKIQIPGFGIVNQLFEINYYRLISLTVLLPIYLNLRLNKLTIPFGKYPADKFLILYFLYLIASIYPYTSFSNLARITFEYFIDIFLPFYVASRYIKSIDQFTDLLQALVIGAIIVGLIGFFEMFKGWMLYSTVPGALGVPYGFGAYLLRGDMLRGAASSGQPIALGFMLMVAFGCFLYLAKGIKNPKVIFFVFSLLIFGLIGPLARGPWIGAVITVIFFIILGPQPSVILTRLLFGGLATLSMLLISPYSSKVIDLLPFIGTVDVNNITFRQDLLTNSLIVIERNPIFGNLNALTSPELEVLRTGGDGGIIDIVNTYIGIALFYGLTGLFLFLSFFTACGTALWTARRRLTNAGFRETQYFFLGNVLLAVLIGVLVTIYTVSSISFIPILYWFIGGLCIAYHQLVINIHIIKK